jgi:hypothetical protein
LQLRLAEGRADWPSLCILGAGFALLAASLYTERWYHWAGVALLLLAWAPWRIFPANAIGLLVAAYSAWLFVNGLFLTPVYSSEGVYQPLMLFGGFVALAAVDRVQRILVFRAGTALVMGLVLLGMAQYLFGIGYVSDFSYRAAATFMTPNTFGTVINLFLAPLAALYVLGGAKRALGPCLWLFAGLVATESRGAMLAFICGLAYMAVTLVMAGIPGWFRRFAGLLGGFAAAWLAVTGLARALATFFRPAWDHGPSLATWMGRPTWDRIEIYSATWKVLMEHPWSGWGANMFFPAFESVKPDLLRSSVFFYAHCDYLQIWLEFGAGGLVLLVLLVAVSLLTSMLAFRRLKQPLLLACGAALAACFAHSAIDFPLYVPLCLMLVGAFLGTLSAESRGWGLPAGMQAVLSGAFSRVSPLIRGTVVVAAIAWLSQPMIAEIATLRSVRLLQQGEARDAIYWESVARRLEPRHAVHYWAEAMIWREQLNVTRNPLFAAEADARFAEGIRANPYEVANIQGRAALHRRYPELLKNPASPEEILSWTRGAAQLRPQQGNVQADHARALAYAGRRDEARSLARVLADKFPRSESVQRLKGEL